MTKHQTSSDLTRHDFHNDHLCRCGEYGARGKSAPGGKIEEIIWTCARCDGAVLPPITPLLKSDVCAACDGNLGRGCPTCKPERYGMKPRRKAAA
jgi:hypothetical protein